MAKPGSAKTQNRLLAAKLLSRVAQGRSLTELLGSGLESLESRDQAFVKELVFGVCRWHYRLEAISEQLISKPLKPKEREVKALVLLGLYQLIYTRVKPHAAVSETAEAARKLNKKWAVGLINAVLRRFQREQEALLEQADQQEQARFSHPTWLLKRLKRAWPDDWQKIAEAANGRPPMSLRIQTSRIGLQQYQKQLMDAGFEAEMVSGIADGLVLGIPVDAQTLPGFAEGQVSVQDCGAQLAAHLMQLEPGQKVLDACAAPGGKSCHMLELMQGDIELTAIDVDATRLKRVSENLKRLNLTARVAVGDAASPAGDWAMEAYYDRILLDVPCSATGVIRRHPDIKLLRRAGDIDKLVILQQKIVAAIWPLLKPGGMLLYATCSLLPEENEDQVARFIENQSDAKVRAIEADWGVQRSVGRQTLPGQETMDGFYYARLEKVE